MSFCDYKPQLSTAQEFYFSLSILTRSCRWLSSLLKYPVSLLSWWTNFILQWEKRNRWWNSLIFLQQTLSLTCIVPSLSPPLHLSEDLPFPIKADRLLVCWVAVVIMLYVTSRLVVGIFWFWFWTITSFYYKHSCMWLLLHLGPHIYMQLYQFKYCVFTPVVPPLPTFSI